MWILSVKKKGFIVICDSMVRRSYRATNTHESSCSIQNPCLCCILLHSWSLDVFRYSWVGWIPGQSSIIGNITNGTKQATALDRKEVNAQKVRLHYRYDILFLNRYDHFHEIKTSWRGWYYCYRIRVSIYVHFCEYCKSVDRWFLIPRSAFGHFLWPIGQSHSPVVSLPFVHFF